MVTWAYRLGTFGCIGVFCLCSAYLLVNNSLRAQTAENRLSSVLESIRAKYKLPAIAGAIFNSDGLVEMAAIGMRKVGDPTPVTADDLWHMGSDSKAMTAALAGTYVAEGKLSWNATVISFFPQFKDKVPDSMRQITLAQVLMHQAGLVENLNWPVLSQSGTLGEQRLAAVQIALTTPAYAPGAFHYSNTDYVVVGAILEKIGGKPWEDLISERLFQPLRMKSAGFGGLGTPGSVDQPWPHLADGTPTSVNGPRMDNPEIIGPAGTVHCTIADWTKFLVDQLRGGAGLHALMPTDIYQLMQPPAAADGKDTYGFGWGICTRDWAGGKTLNHAGSNTMNYCVCWLAPTKKFGVLVCTNQGGDVAAKATDEASSALIQRYLASAKAKPAP